MGMAIIRKDGCRTRSLCALAGTIQSSCSRKREQTMGNTLQRTQEERLRQGTPEERFLQGSQEERGEYVSEFTCQICIEPMSSNMKFRNIGFCSHDFCLPCIAKHIQVQVESRIRNIACPGIGCEHALDPISCRYLTSESLFLEWCDLLCDSLVSGLDHCYCPYPRCSAVILDECRNEEPKITCLNCRKDFCFRCKIPWHAGYKCSESGQVRDRNDILAGKIIEKNGWTRCGSCGHSVERTGGCITISCRCGAQFCHNCGGVGRKHSGVCPYRKHNIVFFVQIVALFVILILSYFGAYEIAELIDHQLDKVL